MQSQSAHRSQVFFSLTVLAVESITDFLCLIMMFYHQHLHPDEGCWGMGADHSAVLLQVSVKWSQERVSVASWMSTTSAGNASRERQFNYLHNKSRY